jgi:hypothetical protein
MPNVFNVLRQEALEVTCTRFGSVGQLYRGEGVEAVWVSKREEDVDPDWFSQDRVDLILVVQGGLRFEFERDDLAPRILGPGDFMILPPHSRCRAYRWPREQRDASIFVAVYPTEVGAGKDPEAGD